jgi:hypothetical protein
MDQAHIMSRTVSQREVTRLQPTRDGVHRELESYAVPTKTGAGMALMVREAPVRYGAYEPEGSEHRSLGSVPIRLDAHWTATLTVAIPLRDAAFIELARQGELPPGYRGGEESASLSLPIGEIDALIELLSGVVAQARRDGVLPTE